MMTEVSVQTLLGALHAAHDASALRNNLSHEALVLAATGSGNYVQSIAAAMMTLGGLHAPVVAICAVLQMPFTQEQVTQLVQQGGKMPGWGNSFLKGQPDPAWGEVDAILRELNLSLMQKMDDITAWLHAAGKRVYPNPGGYTAAAALTMGMQPEASPYLVVSGRLAAWTREFCRIVGER